MKHNKESKRNESKVQEVNLAIPPDGGYGWMIVIAAFVTNAAVDGIAFSFGIALLPTLSKELHLPLSKVAVISSIQLGTYYLCGPLACAFVNHYGFRAVGMFGCVIAFGGLFIASHIPSFAVIIALYGVIAGIGFGMIYTAGIICVGYYFEKYRALATGFAVCGSSVGGVCLSPLFAYIADERGWAYTMRMQSFFLLACLVSTYGYRHLKPTTKVPLTEDVINEMDHLNTPSRVEFVELYKTSSMVSIDLDDPDHSEESRHFPQISIISSRFLPITQTRKKRKRCSCSWIRNLCSVKHTHGDGKMNVISTGPMDRKDIFYSASVVHLPEYKMTQKKDSVLNRRNMLSYHLSMILDAQTIRSSLQTTGLPIQTLDIQEHSSTCFGISHMIQKALRNLLDVSLLKSVVFCVIALASFCYSLGWITPYVYLPERGAQNNISESYTRWFISCISIGNAIGRISSGVIATLFSHINVCYLGGIATMVAGIITIITSFVGVDNPYVQICYCVVFGFCIAFLSVLRPVIVVKLLGLHKLTNAFGLSSLVVGIGLLAGTPIASALFENTESFLATFLLCGSFFTLSGALIILAFHISLWQEEKNKI